jgi:hypothetical protein
VLHQLTGRRRHGQQHLVRLLLGDHRAQVGRRAAHCHPEDLLPQLARVVVHEAHRHQRAAGAGQHLAGQRGTRLAGTDHHDPQPGVALLDPASGEKARLEPHRPHQERGQRRRRDDGLGPELNMQHQHGYAEQRHGHGARLDQPPGLVHARVPPDVPVDAEQAAHDQEHDHHDGQEEQRLPPGRRLRRTAVAQEQDCHQRQGRE